MTETNNGGKRTWTHTFSVIIAFALMQGAATVFITDKFALIQERQAIIETKQETYDNRLAALVAGGTVVAQEDHTRIALLEQTISNQQAALVRIEGLANTNNNLLAQHLNETKKVK